MQVEFIPYEQALALEELGFNEGCFGYYYTLNGKDWKFAEKSEYYRLDDEINIGGKFSLLVPLYQQAFRWFREKYKLFGCIDLHISTPTHWYIRIDDIIKNDYMYHSEDENLKYNTYEEAELACLNKLIELAKIKL
jgi:hypothetical protein